MTDVDETTILDAFVQIGAKIGEQTEALERDRKWWLDARKAETPRRARFNGSATTNVSGFVVIGMNNEPAQGRFWLVRKMTIGGTEVGAAISGSAYIFVSAAEVRSARTIAECPTGDWQDMATTLPQAGDFSPGELPVMAGERLYVVINNGDANTQYAVSGVVEEFQEAAVSPDWAI